MTIAYVSGPVDAREVYADAAAKREPSYFGTSYLAQLAAVARAHRYRAVVITTLPDIVYDDLFEIDRLVNIPTPVNLSGLRFHFAMVLWSLRALRLLWLEKPDVLVLTANTNYFFMFSPLRLRGTKITVALHCTLWTKFGRTPEIWKLFRWLNKLTIFRHASSILCASPDIADQVRSAADVSSEKIRTFLPTYERSKFSQIVPPVEVSRRIFRILFVGRIEENKGTFDLLTAAMLLRNNPAMPKFQIDFCGDGSAIDRLRDAVSSPALVGLGCVHGFCATDELREFYGLSHVVVVPTRSDFEEGYNMVCAEAVLAGRPVVTSAVCPALADIRPAAVEAQVDDAESYADAILRLATNSILYTEKCNGAALVREQYFDTSMGYAACLNASLDQINHGLPNNYSETKATIAYVSGPVDARKIHADAAATREPAYFGTSYLAQLLRLAHSRGGRAVVVTTLTDTHYDTRAGDDRLVNLAPPTGIGGLRFHIAMMVWGLRTLRLLWRERPDVAVLTAGANYFFLFAPLRWRGTSIIVSLHCTLWPKFGRAPRSWAVFRWLNARLIFRHAVSIQCVSSDIRDQVVATVPEVADRVRVFRPTYDPKQFDGIRAPDFASRDPYRILFVGRIEANKGPFDLLAVAAKLHADTRMPAFRIDFCGGGGDLALLRTRVEQHGLAGLCFVQGVCDADRVRTFYGDSHIVVVPTRSDFEEGYNKVCAEAVLAGRPVVTSAACPALADIRDAAVEALVDDIDSYVDAILRLATDPALYAEKCNGAASVREQYFDPGASYGACLEASLERLGVFD